MRWLLKLICVEILWPNELQISFHYHRTYFSFPLIVIFNDAHPGVQDSTVLKT